MSSHKTKTTCENAKESETKKCGFAKDCTAPAVGVISALIFHTYVCRKHAKEIEEEERGYFADYNNWRLKTIMPECHFGGYCDKQNYGKQ